MDDLAFDLDLPVRGFAVSVTATVPAGTTLVLAGPSGAGKSTILRALAGLARPRAGRIALGSRTLLDTELGIDEPPEARGTGFVFQDYALFPHRSVQRNVAYGARRPIAPLLADLGIAHLARALPGTLSGGERQRVALARALARDPGLLLLDEPLSALDPHTRGGVRALLRRVLRTAGVPAIVVSHSFEDAVELADVVGVLVQGRLRQLAPPAELLARPADGFVARLAGHNVLPGVARPIGGGRSEVRLDDGQVLAAAGIVDGRCALVVPPWALRLRPAAAAPGGIALTAVVGGVLVAGDRVRLRAGDLAADLPTDEAGGLLPGQAVELCADAAALRVVPDEERP